MGGEAIFLLLGLAMLAFGGVFLVYARRIRQQSKQMQSWATTTGHIVSATVEQRQSSKGRRYYPALVYAYEANGLPLQGTRVSLMEQPFPTTAAAERQIASYPASGEVTVYYDPADPSESALTTEASGCGIGLFGLVGGLFAAIGMVFVIVGLAVLAS